MREFTGKLNNIAIEYGTGKPSIYIQVDEDAETLFQVCAELMKLDKLSIKIGKYTKKRSLDANAYFHVLVNEIAKKLNTSDDEVKRMLVKRYGTLARDDNGDIVGAMLPAGTDVDRFYPYTRSYKTEYRDGKEYTCYLFYERTRYLDNAQMSHLIEGAVSEAKELGIEVKPKEEIESLLKSWKG